MQKVTQKCCLCHKNITTIKNCGVKCTKCTKWIHWKCSQLPPSHEIWTCTDCKRRSSLVNRRPSRSSFGSSHMSSGSVNNSAKISSSEASVLEGVTSEIKELKNVNKRIIEALAALEGKIERMNGTQEEVNRLKIENLRLKEENTHLWNKLKNNDKSAVMRSATDFTFPSTSAVSPSGVESLNNDILNSKTPTNVPLQISAKPIRAVQSLKWIHVSNLQPTTTSEDLISYVTSKIEVESNLIVCSRLTPKTILKPFYISYKIGLPEKVSEDVINNDFWPENVKIRDFTSTYVNKPRGIIQQHENFRHAESPHSVM
ncbi:CLUMA_CG021142, isoform A [Clunio marinus]|uniref:CLUMA_CG021142, isoform A n=1 Tax=Clunio marinus TaxID=568069 RepID=A0A1J1J8D7_9DIPT|nr:CLUMA_CG021142, isoform A [Clunio marinus]